MYGAIIGDIIGSIYKSQNYQKDAVLSVKDMHFTGDTVQLIATIDALTGKKDYSKTYKEWCLKYPRAGYGKKVSNWIKSTDLKSSNMFDNSSAVRAIPVGWTCNTLDQTIKEARESAIISHNHPLGINGAKAIAGLIYLARTGKSKQDLEIWAEKYYDLDFSLKDIIPYYEFDATCQGSVPQAIVAFLEGKDFMSCIQNAISLNGDTTSIAAIVGGLAEAYSSTHKEYKIPKDLFKLVKNKCPEEFIKTLGKVRGDYKSLYR